jgi:hypothetical protein
VVQMLGSRLSARLCPRACVDHSVCVRRGSFGGGRMRRSKFLTWVFEGFSQYLCTCIAGGRGRDRHLSQMIFLQFILFQSCIGNK